MKTYAYQRDQEWISAFVERVQVNFQNVSPLTLRAVVTGISGDKALRGLSGRAAAERWLERSRSTPPATGS